MNPAFYGAMANPLQRLAQGDVQLGSLFVQMHAALIICAVQKGDMHVVKGDDGKLYVRLTDQGKVWNLTSESKDV